MHTQSRLEELISNNSVIVFFHRFISKINIPDNPNECWMWTAGCFTNGYGQFQVNNKPKKAHRVMYELTNGAIQTGMIIRHKCDNKICVNPDHLEIGTHIDNMKDMRDRNRGDDRHGEKHPCSILTLDDVRNIRLICIPRHRQFSCTALGKKYGVSVATISAIITNKRWNECY